jgi:hypothetical protein
MFTHTHTVRIVLRYRTFYSADTMGARNNADFVQLAARPFALEKNYFQVKIAQ